MTSTSKTILFFGTEDFSAYTLERLINSGFTIGAIITKPDTKRGRNKQLVKPHVKAIGEAHNIPVWQPHTLNEIADDIRAFDSPVGVLVSFGKIIPQSIIDLFSPGIINLHPSLLPRYRGPSPIESAILNGDDKTGVSIMQLSTAMDAGPVYLQDEVSLDGHETAPNLYESLGKRGAQLLVDTLPAIIDGSLEPIPQDDAIATYCQLIKKTDGIVDWSKPASQLEREIRSYIDWPGSHATLGNIEVIITSAHIENDNHIPYQLNLRCGDSRYLSIDTLKPIGKKEMPVQAFLAGYKNRIS